MLEWVIYSYPDEIAVVSDLEFLGLRKHQDYEHRPHLRQVREVEAEVIPPELSGALAVASHPGCCVISKTQADETQRRAQEAAAKIDSLLEAKRNGGCRRE